MCKQHKEEKAMQWEMSVTFTFGNNYNNTIIKLQQPTLTYIHTDTLTQKRKQQQQQ